MCTNTPQSRPSTSLTSSQGSHRSQAPAASHKRAREVDPVCAALDAPPPRAQEQERTEADPAPLPSPQDVQDYVLTYAASEDQDHLPQGGASAYDFDTQEGLEAVKDDHLMRVEGDREGPEGVEEEEEEEDQDLPDLYSDSDDEEEEAKTTSDGSDEEEGDEPDLITDDEEEGDEDDKDFIVSDDTEDSG